MTAEFVRIGESNGKYREEYVGVIDGRTKDTVTVICQGPDEKSSIRREVFDLNKWTITPVKEDVVRRRFEFAMIQLRSHENEQSLEFQESQHKVKHSDALFKEVFK